MDDTLETVVVVGIGYGCCLAPGVAKTALLKGGAGFIGSHVSDELLREGFKVRVPDCLDPQVHRED